MVGEIGGNEEEKAAEFIRDRMTKPVLAYIAGFTAPPGKTMGHAGAIISGSSGTAQAKKEALEACGVRVGTTPTEVAQLVADAVGARGLAARQASRRRRTLARADAAAAHPRDRAAGASRPSASIDAAAAASSRVRAASRASASLSVPAGWSMPARAFVARSRRTLSRWSSSCSISSRDSTSGSAELAEIGEEVVGGGYRLPDRRRRAAPRRASPAPRADRLRPGRARASRRRAVQKSSAQASALESSPPQLAASTARQQAATRAARLIPDSQSPGSAGAARFEG